VKAELLLPPPFKRFYENYFSKALPSKASLQKKPGALMHEEHPIKAIHLR
jgi:hypothetical protein